MLSMRNGCFLFGRSEFFVELSVSEITWTYKTNGKLKIELLFRVCDINHISQLSLNQTMIRRNIGLQNIHENRLNEYGEKEKVLARLRQSNWGTNYNEMNEYWCVMCDWNQFMWIFYSWIAWFCLFRLRSVARFLLLCLIHISLLRSSFGNASRWIQFMPLFTLESSRKIHKKYVCMHNEFCGSRMNWTVCELEIGSMP